MIISASFFIYSNLPSNIICSSGFLIIHNSWRLVFFRHKMDRNLFFYMRTQLFFLLCSHYTSVLETRAGESHTLERPRAPQSRSREEVYFLSPAQRRTCLVRSEESHKEESPQDGDVHIRSYVRISVFVEFGGKPRVGSTFSSLLRISSISLSGGIPIIFPFYHGRL